MSRESRLDEAYRSERKLMMDYAKLRVAFNETLARLIAANEETEANYMDEDYCNLLRELGVEVNDFYTPLNGRNTASVRERGRHERSL